MITKESSLIFSMDKGESPENQQEGYKVSPNIQAGEIVHRADTAEDIAGKLLNINDKGTLE